MKESLSINEAGELNPLFKINDHLDKLRQFIPPENPIIISSGSAVYLYQIFSGKKINTDPKDLDVILLPIDFQKISEKRDLLKLDLRDQPRITRFGMEYHNLLLEGEGEFSLDVMAHLNTFFPSEHELFSNTLYTYPNLEKFPLTRKIKINGQIYDLVSPSYILFYKLTQMREGVADNGTIKQDEEDIKRIIELGIVDPEEVNLELYYLTYGDDEIRKKILDKLNFLTGKRIDFLPISPPEWLFEEQIISLTEFSNQLNAIFGQGNWCYSNGSALALHAYSQGKKRNITDIDIFYLGDGSLKSIFPSNFFNIPFVLIKFDSDPHRIHGIDYLAPQLKGRLFFRRPITVDIIEKSHMRKGGQEMIITKAEMAANIDYLSIEQNPIPVMGLDLLMRIKKFQDRPLPKTDRFDLFLINQLSNK